jgi:AbrB family looped-hinge helix DNA binding protein
MTSKGRVTIPKEVRERLALKEGDRLVFRYDYQGNLLVRPESQGPPLGRLYGILAHLAGDRYVTIEEMNEGIKQRGRAKFDGSPRTQRPFPGKEAVREEVGQWLGKRANRSKG